MVMHLGTVNLMQININPVPRTYVRGIEAFPLQGSQNNHPRAHARGVLWYGVYVDLHEVHRSQMHYHGISWTVAAG